MYRTTAAWNLSVLGTRRRCVGVAWFVEEIGTLQYTNFV